MLNYPKTHNLQQIDFLHQNSKARLHEILSSFYWTSMKKGVRQFLQQNKMQQNF